MLLSPRENAGRLSEAATATAGFAATADTATVAATAGCAAPLGCGSVMALEVVFLNSRNAAEKGKECSFHIRYEQLAAYKMTR